MSHFQARLILNVKRLPEQEQPHNDDRSLPVVRTLAEALSMLLQCSTCESPIIVDDANDVWNDLECALCGGHQCKECAAQPCPCEATGDVNPSQLNDSNCFGIQGGTVWN
jgi:hypothetical protein